MPAEPPARGELIRALRDLVSGSRFGSLAELSASMPNPIKPKRISEFLSGMTLPDEHHIEAINTACRTPDHVRERIRQLYKSALAERTRAGREREPLARGAYGMRAGQLPLVRDFTDWGALGVHRPITITADHTDLSAQVDAGRLPPYVLRDKDKDELRPHLSAMAGPHPPADVRLIVIAGDSSAGKTRMAVEAMRAELNEWQLLVPIGVCGLSQLLSGQVDLRHTVVWLDEVQDFLDRYDGADLLHRLFAAPQGPTVLLATIRTDVEERLRGTSGWRLLDRRAVRIHLSRRFEHAELLTARELDSDPWIRDGLAGIGDRYGLAEVLAAGPQLVREWDRMRDQDPVAAAILDAAVDCHRAGYVDPLPERLLYEAHQYYVDRSVVSPAAFAAALNGARQPIYGASSPLVYTHRGDRAFDYLLTHASASGFRPVAAPIWTLLARHATPGTLRPLAHAARRGGHHHLAAEYLRRAASPAIGDVVLLGAVKY